MSVCAIVEEKTKHRIRKMGYFIGFNIITAIFFKKLLRVYNINSGVNIQQIFYECKKKLYCTQKKSDNQWSGAATK
jgi:hypothetical protein